MSIELHCARMARLCLVRLKHAALATCIAGFGAGCSEAPRTAPVAAGALDAAVSYPSSAAYDVNSRLSQHPEFDGRDVAAPFSTIVRIAAP